MKAASSNPDNTRSKTERPAKRRTSIHEKSGGEKTLRAIQPNFNLITFENESQQMNREELLKYYQFEMRRIELGSQDTRCSNNRSNKKNQPFKNRHSADSSSNYITKDIQSLVESDHFREEEFIDSGTKCKLIEDADQLQNWLAMRNPEKE